MKVIRDMGRTVPPEAQDPTSEAYYNWLADLAERGEIHPTKINDPMMRINGKRVRVTLEAREEDGQWVVQ